MENLTKSSEQEASKSNDSVMDLVMGLYESRDVMPLQAEEKEDDQQGTREEG